MPFVPDLYVDVLLDRDGPQDIDRRVGAYLEGAPAKSLSGVGADRLDFGGRWASGRPRCLAYRYRLVVCISKRAVTPQLKGTEVHPVDISDGAARQACRWKTRHLPLCRNARLYSVGNRSK